MEGIVYQILVRPTRKFLVLGEKGSHLLARVFARLHTDFIIAMKRKNLLHSSATPPVQRALDRYYDHLRAIVPRLPLQPKISIILPVHKVAPRYLIEALASIAAQTYGNWELCAVDDHSQSAPLTAILQSFAAAHPGKVRLAVNERNLHIALSSNVGLGLATGDFVTFLDHDDRYYPNSLAEIVRHMNDHGDPDILYSDSRAINESGEQFNTIYCKPDWSPFMHLSFNYTSHMSVYRRSLVEEIGGFRQGFDGSQDYDLMLRATEKTKKKIEHVPFCLYQWRVHPQSTALSVAQKPYAVDSAIRALTEAMARRGRPGTAAIEMPVEHYRCRFDLPEPRPLISVIIPTKNGHDLVRTCLEGVFQRTAYKELEVLLVDNGSDEPASLKLFDTWAKREPARFRRIAAPMPFNFAALNNLAVKEAKGQYLLLLNNDTDPMHPEWIDEMLRYAQFPEVGAVGAKLHYSDGSLQHAGLLLVEHRIAGTPFEREDPSTPHYYGYPQTPHETSAVTAACLMISRAKYLEVGGLDEIHTPNGYGDIDFCLKLRERGYSNVYTPWAKLYHHESKTRGMAIETYERHHMVRRWGAQLINDPYINLNLERVRSMGQNTFVYPDLESKDYAAVLAAVPWYVQTTGQHS